MAYTYEDFLSYLPQQGLSESNFSAEDLALAKKDPTAGVALMEAKVDYKAATTDSMRALANANANKVRSQAGYSGGIDGANGNASLTPDDVPGYKSVQNSAVPNAQTPASQAPVPQAYTPYQQPAYTQPYDLGTQTPSSFQAGPAPDPFAYEKQAPVYQSTGNYTNQYADQQKQALGNVTNYAPFSFDAENNQQMQAYTKQYRREGDRAMQDTIGSLSAATGGIPSTAVGTAAGQANDYYMSQLNDKLPQIYESEYNKYLSDFGIAQNKLGAINTQENIDYSKYWDGEKFNFDKFLSDLDQYNQDRGQSFNEYQSGLNQYNQDRNFGYGQTVDDLNFKTGRNDMAYNNAVNADNQGYARTQDAYNNAVNADNTAYERTAYADETAYNRGRDTVNDTNYAAEQARIAENDAFDKKYKIDALNADEKTTEYNKAVDRFELMKYADAQTAKTLGVAEGTTWGGEEADIALQQSKKNLELTQANINNVNKDTQYVGVDTGSGGGGRGYATDEQINAAYKRAMAGEPTGADIALLGREGIDISNVSGDTGGGTDEYNAAMARWKSLNGTDADRKLLEENNVPKETLDKYVQNASPQTGGGTDNSWKADYDKASLDKLMVKYPGLTEEQIDANVSSGKFTVFVDKKTGLIYVGEPTKANH